MLFIVLFFIIRLFAVWRYAGRIFNAGICRGKAISEFRSPKALPLHPHPLGHGRSSALLCVLRCCVCCVVDFCLYDAVLRMERCADLVSVFFGTYGDTLCRSAIWFWDSSVLMVVCCADLRSGSGILRYLWWFAVPICDLVLGFFGTYGCMLCRSGSGFFDIYDGTLCRSGSCILDSLMFL